MVLVESLLKGGRVFIQIQFEVFPRFRATSEVVQYLHAELNVIVVYLRIGEPIFNVAIIIFTSN